MHPASLSNFFQTEYSIPCNHPILQKLDALEQMPDAFCGVVNLSTHSIRYASKSIESILGYPHKDFLKHGTRMMYEITPDAWMERVMNQTAFYVAQSKRPGFNPADPDVFEIEAAFLHKAGQSVHILQWGVFIRYTPEGEFAEMLAINYVVDQKDEQVIRAAGLCIFELLTAIKQHLVSLFPENFKKTKPTESVSRNYHPLEPYKTVTERESVVLKLLSGGLSTKAIAVQLGVSPHTVETHRKKLLVKLNAKNSAELVKYATRFFWLE